MRTYWVLLCLFVLAVASLPGHCTIPSWRGYTGLMIIPTADALGKGDWNVGAFMEDVSSGTANDLVGNYGLYQGLEVGVDIFRLNEDSGTDTVLDAKYRFLPETPSRPAAAVGIWDVTDSVQTTVYVVLSKSLGCNLKVWRGEALNPRIHVGLGAGRLDGFFAGGSAYIGRRLQLMAEWDGDNVNAGLRYRVTEGLTLHAGGFNLSDVENNGDESFPDGVTFGAGISYNMIY